MVPQVPLQRGGAVGLHRHALVTHLLSNFERIPFRVDTGWINVNVVTLIDTRGPLPRQPASLADR